MGPPVPFPTREEQHFVISSSADFFLGLFVPRYEYLEMPLLYHVEEIAVLPLLNDLQVAPMTVKQIAEV